MERWRLILDAAGPAAWNMAVDEAVLEAVAAGEQPPTLRLYRWAPPAVSLGYFQRLEQAVDEAACREAGVHVVRRPTGGRAVFHHQELTYSVALPPGHRASAAGVLESYRILSEALREGLRRLGVEAELARPAPRRGSMRGSFPEGACFDAASRYELEWQGRKLVGSAQTRRASGAVLQHGSVLIEFDPEQTARLLSPGGRGRAFLADVLRHRAVSLREALGRPVSWDEVAQAMAGGFGAALGVEWQPGGLSPRERVRAEQLAVERYASDEWNRLGPRRLGIGISRDALPGGAAAQAVGTSAAVRAAAGHPMLAGNGGSTVDRTGGSVVLP